ncbi:glycerol 3-phosphate dehydrogenase (quinone) subunit C [Desulforamulus reducens MI-1]|uniref:Glycerol 3-phosphate dehydrogenase (Quinone) subunit C n=1 Tax=Desulforamulus reducens (strain ATCC BAA-1160 / DSM 100696 / MI-1) TaxID=349161 RepID=A4J8E3_DESRM|nr:anaerobic glycerol-3-phosphate dehydrogenase subunit C [Desulforamulus reducens]ABO51346.1 glycerol 3-phosphate dehydrogenase (quinone) subunit C [Desulforamulus reducens MI-1]
MTQGDRVALDNCIKCSICVSHCPVARVTDKFAGPKQNGPDLERFRLEEPAAVHPSIGYCSNCKTCDVVCPSGVSISVMNCKAKGEYVSLHGAPLRDKLLCRVEMMGKMSRLAPSLVNVLGGIKPLRILGEMVMGVSSKMTLPQYAPKTFLQLYKPQSLANCKGKVLYYPGCYVNYNNPEVGLALVKVLNHHNIEVMVDQFECCGLPIIANGFLDVAKGHAERNIQKLKKYAAEGYQIITTCPSCNLTLGRDYHELFDLDTSEYSVMDAFEYLDQLLEQGELKTDFCNVSLKLGYHQPCHLKAAGSGVPSLAILQRIPGLQVQDLDAGCCGLSGSYGFKKEKYPISQEIGQNITRAVQEMAVDQVITECGMCQLQIFHLTHQEVIHPIQILARAYKL